MARGRVNEKLNKLKADLAREQISLAKEAEKVHEGPNPGVGSYYLNKGWMDYFRLTSHSLLKQSEEQILKCLKTPWETRHVNIGPVFGGPELKISTLSMNTESKNTPLVLVHGLGAGIAMWVLNLDDLAKDRPVYAIDMLGFGRSSRPTFSSDPKEAEEQIARSFEAWRIQMKLEKFIICGHSFGAYLSTAYSLMYPKSVARLVLVDPWGMKDKPNDLKSTPLHFRVIVRLLQDMNPLSVVRIAGYWGPKLIEKIRPDLSENYQSLVDDAKSKISNYLYHCNARSPTGESAYHTIMSSLAWAKRPMCHRLPQLDRNIPLTIFYGTETWLDHIPFEEIQTLRGNAECSTHMIEGGGHHLYAEKKALFNQIVVNDCGVTDLTLALIESRLRQPSKQKRAAASGGKMQTKVPQIVKSLLKRRKGVVLRERNERNA